MPRLSNEDDEPKGRRKSCPHKNIIYCPLYVASHGLGGGCDDGRLDDGGCAVDRGTDYSGALAGLKERHLSFVAELAVQESYAEQQDQIRRNMRLAGVH